MIIRKTMLYGNSVNDNALTALCSKPLIIIPGVTNGKQTFVGFTEDTLHMHTLFMGGTGSGKTNTFCHLIPQLQRKMTNNDVMLVFDSKQDFEQFHREDDYVISYRAQSKGEKETWNLFRDVIADGWEKESIIMNADEIADVIFSKAINESSQPFFPRAAKDIFAAIIKGMCFIGITDKDYRINYMNNKALIKYLTALNAEKLHAFLTNIPELAGVLKYIGNGKSEQALGVFAELQSVVGHIFTRNFAEDGRFSIRKTVQQKNGRTLFIEYDPSRGVSLRPIYQLLVDLFLKEALTPKDGTKGNVFVICDELKMLPFLNHLEDALNFGRSLGVSVIAGIQSMEQLYEVYGEYGGKNIASAFQTVFCFHTNDVASRQYIKGMFGENKSVIQYMTPSGKTIEEQHSGYSVEDWDITNLNKGEAIVGMPYQLPFKIKIKKYGG
ncbi:MAG: DUF87 domain-containing protein [Ruminococcaceae bacterium]|nr:DUF87 domain-containing protein [Oscillospiraceae bacterium]